MHKMSGIKVVVTFRRTSHLTMSIVKNGDVHVSAPHLFPRSEVEKFVNDHQEWIEKAHNRTLAAEEKRKMFYAQLPLKKRSEREEAIQRLDFKVKALLAFHAPKMGVKPSEITYKATKSRWGMCDVRTKQICFSLYLLLLPDWCIEHVVVHELAHLKEANHGPRFYALMDQHFPMWKEAKKATAKIVI